MKKFIGILCAVAVCAAMAGALAACGNGEENKPSEPDTATLTYEATADGNAYAVKSVAKGAVKITVPYTYEGKPVTEIAKEAFKGNNTLTEIALPSSLTTIGESAFENCKVLASAEIPAAVTKIGNNAFQGCNAFSDNDATLASIAFKNTAGDPFLHASMRAV